MNGPRGKLTRCSQTLSDMPDTCGELTIQTALLSVSDKTGIVELAQALAASGVRLLSTGGTARTLQQAGIAVTEVSTVTGQPEIMDGRVKTLHPVIHGGLLGRRDQDAQVMDSNGITAIDLLVVNLYPFADTIARPDCSLVEAIEQIDIGGPAMLRAASKNHAWVTVLTDPADYATLSQQLPSAPELSIRRQLALKGFQMTAAYDAMVSHYLAGQFGPADAELSGQLNLNLTRQQALRYGENPQQAAAFYRPSGQSPQGFAAARLHQGKPLSYNNMMDADGAWSCLQAVTTQASSANPAACVIVKHANPCGAACGENISAAYQRAFDCDSTSAFGGIIALNQRLDEAFARHLIGNQFLEVLLAPEIEPAALKVLSDKPNVRVLTLPLNPLQRNDALDYRRIAGGYLVQQPDLDTVAREVMQVVSQRPPSEQEWRDMLFAWQLVRFVKSNAVVYAKNQQSVGIGAGQMSRIDSARIALEKAAQAKLTVAGCAMASEAFFPFRDSIDQAHAAAVSSIIQPGGSRRDQEVIDAANEHDMAMVFTTRRHFRH